MAKDNREEKFSVFDAPTSHTDKKPKGKKGKTFALISGILSVLLVVTAIIVVDKVIPENKEETNENALEPFKIIEVSPESFESVTVTSDEGIVELYSEQTENDKKWYIKGYEKKDVSSSISSLLNAASNITAYSEVTKKTASECGFDNPRYTVAVKTQDNKGFTILVGSASPDNFGMYLKFADSDKIYLVSEELLGNFIIDAKAIMENITADA